jgi:hypothetical protein
VLQRRQDAGSLAQMPGRRAPNVGAHPMSARSRAPPDADVTPAKLLDLPLYVASTREHTMRPTANHLAGAILATAVFALTACGGGSEAKEASFEVWESGCQNLQTFTRKEVVAIWGRSAVAGDELKGTPARINDECEEKLGKAGK